VPALILATPIIVLVSILVTTDNMSLSSLSVFHWFLKLLSNDTPSRPNAPAISKVSRPAFNDLPLQKGDPKGSAWQFWGRDDELGSLNLITEEVSRAAASEVVLGRSINLKYVPRPIRIESERLTIAT
jgi:hypothetical protein